MKQQWQVWYARWRDRLSSLIVLFVLGLMLVAGWRTVALMGASGQALGSATAVSDLSLMAAAEEDTAVSPLTGFEDSLPQLSDSSLAPGLNPHTYQGQLPQHELQTYLVERGDTPNGIADRFGIRPETILGGNPQLSEESSLLRAGVEIIIMPVDGVLHDVQPGDTVEGLALRYGVSVDDIVGYGPNNLEFPYRLYPETQIIIPGAVREVFVWTPPDLSSVVGRTSREGSGVTPVVVGTGTFRYPVNSRNFTQYYWFGHRGIDIALPVGNPVYAADTGTVTFAGWNIYGFGNLIVVNHGNGYETFYAHLDAINIVPGQIVYQGNVIGATGNTGNSSGPHIHFEIRLNAGQQDPCWYLGC
jgi:murein DD-endopeptidase MepM/ murein hydrolase activator NlpD